MDEDAEELKIPIHAFDLIIADECHRGYTSAELSVWRNTLDHFDAIKVGLTATPAAHTKAYFNDIVYRYELQRAGVWRSKLPPKTTLAWATVSYTMVCPHLAGGEVAGVRWVQLLPFHSHVSESR